MQVWLQLMLKNFKSASYSQAHNFMKLGFSSLDKCARVSSFHLAFLQRYLMLQSERKLVSVSGPAMLLCTS